MIKTYVKEVMTSSVERIRPDATVTEAAERLRDRDIGSLVVVVDGDEEPVGIFTESDVVAAVAEGAEASSDTVSEFMSSPPITVEVDEDVRTAAEILRENNIKKLPVVNGDGPSDTELVGIMTTTDISDYVPKSNLKKT